MRYVKGFGAITLGVGLILVVAELGLRTTAELWPDPSPWPSAATELKDRQLGEANSYDVVFLGSSITEAAVDPAGIESVSAYNSALPFSSPISNEIWLDGQWDDLGDTLVVLGVPAWPFHGGFEDDALAGQVASALRDQTTFLEEFELYMRRGLLADWFSSRSRELAVESGSWTALGHQTVYYTRSGDTLAGRFPPFGQPRMSEEAELAIRRMARMVDAEGGELVIMVEPGRYPGDVSSEVVDEYLESLELLATDLHVAFWNTYSIDWDDSLFADEAHFNEQGTILFTEFVGELLDEILLTEEAPSVENRI